MEADNRCFAVRVGPAVAGPRGQGALALGLAVLPQDEDGQGIAPADEPGGPRAPQRHHAGTNHAAYPYTPGIVCPPVARDRRREGPRVPFRPRLTDGATRPSS